MTWNLISFIKSRKQGENQPSVITEDDTAGASPDELTPLDLAFAGDAVYGLLVREYLLKSGSRPVKELHTLAVEMVRAEAQAKAAHIIMPMLSPDETAVYKRGRNAKVGGIPKNATPGEYHSATGLEALFGWLYLNGSGDRIEELFDAICEGNKNEK